MGAVVNKFFRNLVVAISLALIVGCATGSSPDDDITPDAGSAATEAPADDLSPAPAKSESAKSEPSKADAFSDFDDGANKASEPQTEPAKPSEVATQAQPPAQDELTLDDAPPAEAVPAPEQKESIALEPPPTTEPAPRPTMPPPPPVVETPAPQPMPVAVEKPELVAKGTTISITSVKYKANDSGGTVVIEADNQLSFTTRKNPELKQLIVEIPDVVLPKKLQRPLNTRDMQGSIGAIDPYQHAGSNVARFVVQLREGAPEPLVQQEGNSILIVSSPMAANDTTDLSSKEGPTNVDLNGTGILSSQSLSEFLGGNTKFYGKKISMEVNNMDIRDALRFITEESGVNMVIADDVKGNLSLKLRQVPWDQALVMIMRAKSLGYTRQGNILRITTQGQLKNEEEDANRLAIAKRATEPLKVRLFQISYAQVAELEKRVSGFLSERGKVASDPRTNSLVVTDIEEYIGRVAKLIENLDTQPPQVLIEGKIVEATDDFTRSIGVNWNLTGTDIATGLQGSSGPVNLHPSLAVSPGANPGGMFDFNMTLGTLDQLGDLTASLSLRETETKVKVLSSPRIATLTNEPATISQTQEVPVKTVTAGINGGQPLVSYQYKPLKLSLEVTPQITSDASILMKVNVLRQFQGAVVDVASNAFAVNERQAQTRILVKNGQTAVIGGIYVNDSQEAENGVPYLKDIPFLGALFRQRISSKNHSELLIFLTPRILAQISGASAPSGAL